MRGSGGIGLQAVTNETKRIMSDALCIGYSFCDGWNTRTWPPSVPQVETVTTSRRYRKQPRDYDRIRYRERNIVERFINKIKW